MELTAQYFKDYLYQIYKPVHDFELVITSKTPKTRLGYYSVSHCRIVIHYVGEFSHNELCNTAIHELAHHIHFTELNKLGGEERTHGKEFYKILNSLFAIAIQKKLFEDSHISHIISRAR